MQACRKSRIGAISSISLSKTRDHKLASPRLWASGNRWSFSFSPPNGPVRISASVRSSCGAECKADEVEQILHGQRILKAQYGQPQQRVCHVFLRDLIIASNRPPLRPRTKIRTSPGRAGRISPFIRYGLLGIDNIADPFRKSDQPILLWG